MSDADETDLLAAEYVLGTLDGRARAQVASRLGDDLVLTRAVADWEERLSPLLDAAPAVEPPAGVFDGIVGQLFGTDRGDVIALSSLRRRVNRWRAATAGFAALAAALVGWIAVRDLAPLASSDHYSAVLQRDAGAPAMVLDVDLASKRFTIRPIAAATPPDKSYELWLIDPAAGAPRSLGLVPSRADRQASLASFPAAVIADATYAVTVEPRGGSPNGAPSGTPVLTGKLVPASP